MEKYIAGNSEKSEFHERDKDTGQKCICVVQRVVLKHTHEYLALSSCQPPFHSISCPGKLKTKHILLTDGCGDTLLSYRDTFLEQELQLRALWFADWHGIHKACMYTKYVFYPNRKQQRWFIFIFICKILPVCAIRDQALGQRGDWG